jgi:hypothetical protein
MTRSAWCLLILAIFCSTPPAARAQESRCEVRYLSADHVYLDAGSAAGLAAGQRVRVVRGGADVAELEVVFAADHSATCRVVTSTAELRPGDAVIFQPDPALQVPAAGTSQPDTMRQREPSRQRNEVVADDGPRVDGAVGMVWDHAGDSSRRGLESDLVTVPFRAVVSELGGGLEMRARGSLRHTSRSGYSLAPDAEWRNRILEVALVQDDPHRDWNFAVGRLGSRVAMAAGPFDGLRFDRRVATGLRLGAFAGFAPPWQDLGFGTDDQLAGLTAWYNGPFGDRGALDMVLAAAGRYHQGEVSREVIALTTTLRTGDFNLVQSAELDVNRGWRRDAAGNSAGLSSLALTGRWQASHRVALNLGYDDRDPVRTWESRNLPDSLFTDAGRRGLSAGASLRGGRGRSCDVRGSVRRDERTGDDVVSGSGRVFLPAVPAAGFDLDVALRAFDGPQLSGWSPALGLACRARRGLGLRVETGHQAYTSAPVYGNEDRASGWVRLSGQQDLAVGWSVGAEYRRDWGDDIEGDRWLLEWRRRF